MNGILDSVSATSKSFRPQSVREYMALQLAKKLGDTDRLSRYLSLFEHNDVSVIVEAFINAQGRSLTKDELITSFDDDLAALTMKEDDDAL